MSAKPQTDDEAAEPNHGFEDSRRLTGPNRYFAGAAAILTPLGAAADDPAAHARWAVQVRAMARALGWPDPAPVAQRHAGGTLLVMAAPADRLMTATELNEWAWERASDDPSFALAHDLQDGAEAVFAERAAAERNPAGAALQIAAQAHGLPVFTDDEDLSIGAGTGSRTWPLTALPAMPAQVPWTELHDIPTALVAGSNGKTTTVRLLAAIASAAGLRSGYCCTEGVFIGGEQRAGGDYAGPAGARSVLRDRSVQAAVLETARGGILRRGLAVERADVAVVTNVSPDHLGEYGVDSAEDLADVKLVVGRAVVAGGTLVLNADDGLLMRRAAQQAHANGRRALFAMDHGQARLQALRSRGGSTCGVDGGRLLLSHAGATHDLGGIAALPMTLGGAAPHNIANAAAAALAAACLGFDPAVIAATLQRFGSQAADNPGRLERWQHRGATVLIDYAHNPDGLAGLLTVARALQPRRLGLLLGQAGNRDDGAIADLARTAANFAPDLVVVKELPEMLRGRALGDVPALLKRELGATPVADEPDEEAAALRLLAWAQPGDVVVLPVHTTTVRDRLARFLRLH